MDCDTREGGRGCLVFGTKVCTFKKPKVGRLALVRTGIGAKVVMWIVVAFLGVLLALCARKVQW